MKRLLPLAILPLLHGCSDNISSSDIPDTPDPSLEDSGENANDPIDDPEDDPEDNPEDPEDPEDPVDPVDTGEEDPEEPKTLSFSREVIVSQPGAAWLAPIDMNNDGYDEYLLTTLSEGYSANVPPIGAGGAYVLQRDGGVAAGNLGKWSTTEAFSYWDDIDWPNQSTIFDVDGDGVDDWVIGAGFLPTPKGRLLWMKGALVNGNYSFGEPQDLFMSEGENTWFHAALPIDLDNDGDLDVISTYQDGTVFDSGVSQLSWFENQTVNGVVAFEEHPIAARGGALIKLHDLDLDGDLDIVLPQYFDGDSLIWFEQDGSNWNEHLINNTTGRGFDVDFADVNGDGVEDLVYGNHNHQGAENPEDTVMGMYWFEIPAPSVIHSLENWDNELNVIHEGFYVDEEDAEQNGAPGVFHTGDIDSDGDIDVTVSGDGDSGVYVFQNIGNGVFDKILIDDGLIMAGDHRITDLDRDGDMDIIWAVYGPLPGDDGYNGNWLAADSYVYAYLQD